MSTDQTETQFGFAPEEIDTSAPTRAARLKWVIVVNEALPAGRAANAVACVAASVTSRTRGLLGPDAVDASSATHPGLPWAGCTILTATAAQLTAIRERASGSEGVLVADMPAEAQSTRVYDEYLEAVADIPGDSLEYYAVSLVGPRHRVDRIVNRLPLMP